MDEKATTPSLIKIILFVILLPFALIWYVWEKTSWNKRNKWIATAAIAVVFLIIFISLGKDTNTEKQDEIAALNARVENLEKQIEKEKIEASIEASTEASNEDVEPQEEIFKVVNVIDGDTVKLENGKVVRYIGINSPEVAATESATECFGKEASEKNEELVEGKEVTLEKDVSETDKYNRILRYVWIGDIFVNDYLVRNGFGKTSNFPPDEKYKNQLKEAEEEARNNKRGLWADDACKTETKYVPTSVPTPVPAPAKTSGSYTCNCSKTCPNMSSCAEAQYQLNVCGCSRRDGDNDGVACDADCQ